MKKAFGVLNLLITIVIIIVITLVFLKGQHTTVNPFDSTREIKTQEQTINDKINEIEELKNINKQIEENLKKGN